MSNKAKIQKLREAKLPPARRAQNIMAAVPELRETHDSFVRSTLNDMLDLSLYAVLLDVHTAVYEVRRSVDPDATGLDWKPVLPGDRIPMRNLKIKISAIFQK